jgi:hypothetical protein
MFNRITAIDYRGETYTKVPALGRKEWLILGTLFSRPFQPVAYEELATLIGQDPTLPVHQSDSGPYHRPSVGPTEAYHRHRRATQASPVYRAVYLIRRHLTHANSLDRIVRLSPWPSAPRGGYMYQPSVAGRK